MRRRLMRWGKWAGLAGTGLLVAAAVASARWAVSCCAGPFMVHVWVGKVTIQWLPGSAYWFAGPFRTEETYVWGFDGGRTWGGGDLYVQVPLWFLCAVSGLGTVLLRRLDRHGAAGCCPACGYELGGLPAGVQCPECGRGAQA